MPGTSKLHRKVNETLRRRRREEKKQKQWEKYSEGLYIHRQKDRKCDK